MSALILYGHHESGHAYKVALALAIAGIEYEYRWVDILAPREERCADFHAVSKFGEIPVLVDAGSPMAQSNSIPIGRRSGALAADDPCVPVYPVLRCQAGVGMNSARSCPLVDERGRAALVVNAGPA